MCDSPPLEASPEIQRQAPGKDSVTDGPVSWKRSGERSLPHEILHWVTRALAILAVLSSVTALAIGATPLLNSVPAHLERIALQTWRLLGSPPIGAVPLLLAGAAYLSLQLILRPRGWELIKRLMLGSAFLLWGVDLFLPSGDLADELGNLVIALYVVDLTLIIRSDLMRT